MNAPDRIRVYLAGPFFNDAQVKLIERAEQILEACGVPHFSPRKMALNGNPTTTRPTPEQAGDIFRKDYEEICRSTHVIAVMDWTMNPGTSLRVCAEPPVMVENDTPLEVSGKPPIALHRVLSGHLQFPDSGTVWEMGCAYALRVPIYLYTAAPAARLNLMLSQSARGVIYGPAKLAEFLAGGRIREEVLEPWKGDHR